MSRSSPEPPLSGPTLTSRAHANRSPCHPDVQPLLKRRDRDMTAGAEAACEQLQLHFRCDLRAVWLLGGLLSLLLVAAASFAFATAYSVSVTAREHSILLRTHVQMLQQIMPYAEGSGRKGGEVGLGSSMDRGAGSHAPASFYRQPLPPAPSFPPLVPWQAGQGPRAFILSNNERRWRFTIANLERALPGFFEWEVQGPLPLSSPRLAHTLGLRKETQMIESNRLSLVSFFQQVDTHPRFKDMPDDEWIFVFEDDCNIEAPAGMADFNFSRSLLEVMNDPVVRHEDGYFQLGSLDIQPEEFQGLRGAIRHADGSTSQRCNGVGVHANAYTKWRARMLPAAMDQHYHHMLKDGHLHSSVSGYMDRRIQAVFRREGRSPVVWGAPHMVGHPIYKRNILQYGFVFQDRVNIPSSIRS